MTPIPNTFQTPNEYIDRAMQYLGCDELRVLIFATRHILGWKDRIDERSAKISLTTFEAGYKSKAGAVFGGCGLSRPAIKNALDSLVQFGFLIKIGDAGNDGQEWKLGTEIDYPALEDRYAKEAEKKRQKISKAAKASGEKRRKGGTTDVPASSTTHVPPKEAERQYDPRTTTGTTDVPLGGTTDVPKQTHIANTSSNTDKSAVRPRNPQVVELSMLLVGNLLSDELIQEKINQYGFDKVKSAVQKGIAKDADDVWKYANGTLEGWERDAKKTPPTSSAATPPTNGKRETPLSPNNPANAWKKQKAS